MKTRTEIITDAFRKIGGLGDGEAITTTQLDAGEKALRSMTQALVAKGMPIWKLKRYQFSMSTLGGGYQTMGPGGTFVTASAPLKLISAQRYDNITQTTIDLNIYTRTDFFVIPSLQIEATPTHIYTQPQVNTTGDMGIWLWPAPNSYWRTNGSLIVDIQENFNPAQFAYSTPDFPDYWEEAIIYNLAVRLAPEYGLALPDRQVLQAEAKYYLEEALSFGNEEGSIKFEPKMRQ